MRILMGVAMVLGCALNAQGQVASRVPSAPNPVVFREVEDWLWRAQSFAAAASDAQLLSEVALEAAEQKDEASLKAAARGALARAHRISNIQQMVYCVLRVARAHHRAGDLLAYRDDVAHSIGLIAQLRDATKRDFLMADVAMSQALVDDLVGANATVATVSQPNMRILPLQWIAGGMVRAGKIEEAKKTAGKIRELVEKYGGSDQFAPSGDLMAEARVLLAAKDYGGARRRSRAVFDPVTRIFLMGELVERQVHDKHDPRTTHALMEKMQEDVRQFCPDKPHMQALVAVTMHIASQDDDARDLLRQARRVAEREEVKGRKASMLAAVAKGWITIGEREEGLKLLEMAENEYRSAPPITEGPPATFENYLSDAIGTLARMGDFPAAVQVMDRTSYPLEKSVWVGLGSAAAQKADVAQIERWFSRAQREGMMDALCLGAGTGWNFESRIDPVRWINHLQSHSAKASAYLGLAMAKREWDKQKGSTGVSEAAR